MKTQQPIIDPANVQAALDAMVYTSTPAPPNPLWALAVVDEQLTDPDLPASSRAREFALNLILVNLITDGLAPEECARAATSY